MNTHMPSQEKKVAVVTGSSTGIGYVTSLALARKGFLTYATMRNLGKSDEIKSVAEKEKLPLRVAQLDVTDENSIKQAIRLIISEAGRIDVLVNNAGYGLGGAFEDLSMDELKAQYETNVFGLMRVTQGVLPIMRRQRSGRIMNMSSGAGRFGYPGGSAYVSSKFAIEGLSESLAYELEPFGINVVLIEPGFIRTNFASGMVFAKKTQDQNSPYSQLMQMVGSVSAKLMENSSPPEIVASAVVEAATTEAPNLRYTAGKDVEQWLAAKKVMSDEEFQSMMKQGMSAL
jgi:NAD(P)-dependent dehydrogenase (short-subunit alcohol dehydrogenase family)